MDTGDLRAAQFGKALNNRDNIKISGRYVVLTMFPVHRADTAAETRIPGRGPSFRSQ